VSAIYGTGTGEGPFGGTSGAAPMVTGSAALLKQAYPGRSPLEIKAALMNTGETNIMNTPAFFGGDLAAITRIGGGEVRVDRALEAPAAAWDEELPSGALSFGFVDVFKTKVLYKTVVVKNYSNQWIHYQINNTFRFADDQASGAVTIETPGSVLVGPQNRATFYVKMTIDGTKLPPNAMNSGSGGADPAALTLNEYDGYLILTDASGATDPIHLAWHVLPRQAAYVQGRQRLLLGDGQDDIELRNRGLGWAQNDAYALLATSPDIPEGARGAQSPTPDLRAVGVNTFPVPAGYCSAQESFIWAFAINTWERQAHLLPVHHYVWLDTDMDGAADYYLVNRDYSGMTSISDGRQLTYAYDVATGAGSAYFYTEHATNTGNTVLYICAEQVGLTGTDMLATPVGVEFEAFDFYYGGPGDTISGLVVTPYAEQYYGIPTDIPAGGAGIFTVLDFGAWPGDTPELGVMLLTNGDRGAGARGGASQDTEAMLFTLP
jgi:minor extracellular serine protease Vpr